VNGRTGLWAVSTVFAETQNPRLRYFNLGHAGGPVTDDAALVRLCLDGNEQAARQLVERFQSMVFAVCVRMLGQREDAEDVSQDVFLRVFRALRGWDPTRPLQPWILAIAANRCRTALRQRPRDAARSSVEISRVAAEGSGGSRELSDELDLAVATLREEYRLCFVLFYQQELSCAEIASVLNRPEGTVKTWLHRARRELAERLRRRGVVNNADYQLHGV
jgi:RNA polymerase sigma-70 factor, ECF subfamily